MTKIKPNKVSIVMGSQSDFKTMSLCQKVLKKLAIKHEIKIISAHRTPDRLWSSGEAADQRGLTVIIAGAGGAAHLPGMIASKTNLPVVGIPVTTSTLNGIDSLYSILQIPRGYPVATMAIGAQGAKNGGLLAAQIIALSDPELNKRLSKWRNALSASIPDEPQDE